MAGWTLRGEVPEGAAAPALELDVIVATSTALLAPPGAALHRIPEILRGGVPDGRRRGVAGAPVGSAAVAETAVVRVAGLETSLAPTRIGILGPLPEAGRGRWRRPLTAAALLRGGAARYSDAAIERFGLAGVRRTPLDALDAETAGRLALARALAADPAAVLADAAGAQPRGGLPFGDPLMALRDTGFEGPVLLLVGTLEAAMASDHLEVLDRAGNDRGTVRRLAPAQSGPPARVAGDPRTPLVAAERGINLFSGLARKGRLSIGHTPITAATHLDGQVLITLPPASVSVRPDDSDPEAPRPGPDRHVYRAYVVGRRRFEGREQIQLSPANPDQGLPAWGVSAGTELGIGQRVLATVDPAGLHATPFVR